MDVGSKMFVWWDGGKLGCFVKEMCCVVDLGTVGSMHVRKAVEAKLLGGNVGLVEPLDQSESGKSLESMSEFDWVHVGECLHLLCESRLVWEMYMAVGSLQG
jgi:hypothetical protein